MDAHGTKDAAVLVALYGNPLTAVFTERRADLSRHAGEISFPGGRQDEPDEDLRDTALREAEEEIGLPRSAHTWFVLHELLGKDEVKNYDGSWTEWGNLVGVPIE